MTLAASGLRVDLPGRTLLDGVELAVDVGELWVVVGPNGSGKSTLLRILAGVATPSAGTVTLGGRPLADLAPRTRARKIAYLPQETSVFHDLSVGELVMLGRSPYLHRLRPAGPEDHRQVTAALARVQMEGTADRRVSTLSGGERQRVMLARMLATQAAFLVLDEPTTALDIGHALSVLEVCRALVRSGHGIIMAVHDLALARRYADSALALSLGEGVHAGPAAEVLTAARLGSLFDVEARAESGVSFYPTPTVSE